MAGDFWPGDGSNHAFLYTNGTAVDLGLLPGYKSSYSEGMNSGGQVVGYAYRVASVAWGWHDPGDANGDGQVDITDLTIVLTNYSKTGMAWSQGDLNGDTKVDINDLTVVLTDYGMTYGAARHQGGAGAIVRDFAQPRCHRPSRLRFSTIAGRCVIVKRRIGKDPGSQRKRRLRLQRWTGRFQRTVLRPFR